ncbi:ABC transporter [Microbacterium sp. CFBP9034]|uniref:ABC transporter n=1 Tax=Microbacterium sp. CFBP9034 TaxID=3096540 RepID=UPI002A6ADDB8|nr:ABC transporter [Microbacterium sp. CFBP9034]MDY0910310.1 ABC transporter [Microbacterium sp. CFBP9034]
MSDQKSSYGEPVEEPQPVDDVVGRAHEGLAEAEAARRDSVSEPAAEPVDPAAADAASTAAPADDPWDSPDAASLEYEPAPAPAPSTAAYESPAAQTYEPAAETVVAAPVVTPSEPVSETPVVAPVAPQPIFVQAPEAPRLRGNRAAAGAIGLVAALTFAVLYLAVWLVLAALTGDLTVDNVANVALAALGSWVLWLPVVVFFIAFWLLGAIINRGRWGSWVIFGLLVGFAAWGGYLLGVLFQEQFWNITASQGADLMEQNLLAPLGVAAFIIGREITIWFGAWAAARGRRVTELNVEAQREYERTLEAGPQLVRQ